uniref:Uncharacterized protein n=1 Tax=Mesocestoides corti TaxID=53468 RepID=A0A5K3G363_MESCO
MIIGLISPQKPPKFVRSPDFPPPSPPPPPPNPPPPLLYVVPIIITITTLSPEMHIFMKVKRTFHSRDMCFDKLPLDPLVPISTSAHGHWIRSPLTRRQQVGVESVWCKFVCT